MLNNAKLIVVATGLPALVAVGCSSAGAKEFSDTASTSPVTTSPIVDGSDDPGESNGAVRIPLGETRRVTLPADAVLDIKVVQGGDWSALRCTALLGAGQPLDLLPPPPDAQPEQAAHGATWVPLWTVAVAPGAVTVGCTEPTSRTPGATTDFIRVVPRGLPAPR
ncbi:hypothetical protein [Nocardia sp. NBC_00511]|uniref:hypothetical protein n=1 Tax=Nocardia sp. NBC_00511 TaxID=2903591 RepID=UPI0030E07A50